MYVVVFLPYRLAFDNGKPGIGWRIVNYIVDISFFIDVILTFFSAFELDDDIDCRIVTDHKTIAKTYIKTWFFLDLISILPIDEIVKVFATGNTHSSLPNANTLIRVARIGKIYKLSRFLRLSRLFYVFRSTSKVSSNKDSKLRLA